MHCQIQLTHESSIHKYVQYIHFKIYHLLENSGNFWKTPEIYGSSEKVVLFSWLERFEWISLFHLHIPRFSHQFQVIDDFSSHDQAPLRRSV